FTVTQDGMVEITGDQLARLGVTLSDIDPSTIRLYTYPTGMLPQSNSIARPKDLQEVAIEVINATAGQFGKKDKVIFFGQGPDGITYNRSTRTYGVINNLYSDKNHYFLTFGATAGKRVKPQQLVDPFQPVITTWDDYYYNELDQTNILKSGRDWFGTAFDANTLASFSWDMDRVTPGSTVRVVTRLMAEAYDNARFKVTLNKTTPADLAIQAIPQTSYGIKGRTRTDTLSRPADPSVTKHTLQFEYIRGGTNYSIGRLDQFTVTMNRTLAFTGKPLLFFATDAEGFATFKIAYPADARIWNISDPFEPSRMISSPGDGSVTFNGPAGASIRYAMFDPASRLTPAAEGIRIPNQNLQAIGSPDIITIAHPLFIKAAGTLAAHRLRFNGLTSVVVTPQQIYNEYSGGRADVTALRDFIRDVWNRSGKKLRHVLLVGKGSYDYRNLTAGNLNFVPVYESVNSLSPLETYSSDDYFAFLEDHEGNWGERPAEFHTLDIGVGRLPCTTAEEADNIVNKLIAYDTDPRMRGAWRKELAFVADDGDVNIHQGQATQLAASVETRRPELHARRVYLDLFKQEERSFGQLSPQASNALFRTFHEGAAIINFTGHGSEQLWMAERVLDPERIEALNNRTAFPFLVTATCAFGRTDDPLTRSSAERILLKRSSGAIGLVTSARPVSSATNFELNADFYDALFSEGRGAYPTIGEVFRITKNARDSRIANRNFSLLGDPAMTIALPQLEAVVTALEGTAPSGSIDGLSVVTVRGEIRKNGQRDGTYTGTITLDAFRAPVTISTRGNENPVFEFSQWDELFFSGKTTVTGGTFAFTFTAPSGSISQTGAGKMILHAVPDGEGQDAGGFREPIAFSSTNLSISDNLPPQATLHLNDLNFISGGTVNKDPVLLVGLTDESGINISSDATRGLRFTLDGDTTFLIGTYYRSDASGKSGTAEYQLFGLEDGNHRIVLTAQDLAGNTITREVTFTVGETSLRLSDLNGAPNPVLDLTRIRFTNSRPGDDLEGTLAITDPMGREVSLVTFRVDNAPELVYLREWDGTDALGKKLPAGLYILRLDVRSALDGAKNSLSGKLMLTE
ncbi:MAG: type IX secretion system sortase PorU, partial [Bacteroidota bacterium]